MISSAIAQPGLVRRVSCRHRPNRITCVSSGTTSLAAGILDQPLNHQEVLETGERVKGSFMALLKAILPRIAADVRAERKGN